MSGSVQRLGRRLGLAGLALTAALALSAGTTPAQARDGGHHHHGWHQGRGGHGWHHHHRYHGDWGRRGYYRGGWAPYYRGYYGYYPGYYYGPPAYYYPPYYGSNLFFGFGF
jgi:hypothetical protein